MARKTAKTSNAVNLHDAAFAALREVVEASVTAEITVEQLQKEFEAKQEQARMPMKTAIEAAAAAVQAHWAQEHPDETLNDAAFKEHYEPTLRDGFMVKAGLDKLDKESDDYKKAILPVRTRLARASTAIVAICNGYKPKKADNIKSLYENGKDHLIAQGIREEKKRRPKLTGSDNGGKTEKANRNAPMDEAALTVANIMNKVKGPFGVSSEKAAEVVAMWLQLAEDGKSAVYGGFVNAVHAQLTELTNNLK